MSLTATAAAGPALSPNARRAQAVVRLLVIGVISFLTLVDLFAAQAILPTLVAHYRVTPAVMGVAVNSSTIGMAVAGLAVAVLSRRLNRRHGIWISLALLAIPTSLLAGAGDIAGFTALRIAQGVCMSTAFTLTMAYLAEQCSVAETASALAAYITGNVASNFFGRLISAAAADYLGLAGNFYLFAALNLTGAALVLLSLSQTRAMTAPAAGRRSPWSYWAEHVRNRPLGATFAIGFLILFVFIGTFTYVNFVLVGEPLNLGQMSVGLVYFVFLPSVLTTPLAGAAARRLGTRPVMIASLAVAALSLPLLLASSLAAVLAGMVMIGVGTFFAQATATGYVSRVATSDRGSASGIYLASYYLGGLAGSAILGQLFERYGWSACVAGLALALAAAMALATGMRAPVADAGAASKPCPSGISNAAVRTRMLPPSP